MGPPKGALSQSSAPARVETLWRHGNGMAGARQHERSRQEAQNPSEVQALSLSSIIFLGTERNDTLHTNLQKLIECLDDFLNGEFQPAKYSNLS